jgi:hypothetical protein
MARGSKKKKKKPAAWLQDWPGSGSGWQRLQRLEKGKVMVIRRPSRILAGEIKISTLLLILIEGNSSAADSVNQGVAFILPLGILERGFQNLIFVAH